MKRVDLLPGDVIDVRIKEHFLRRDDYGDTHGPLVYQGESTLPYEEPGIMVNHRVWKEPRFVRWQQIRSLKVRERMPIMTD